MSAEFFARWVAQLKAVRAQVDQVHNDAEAELESMETRKGITSKDLEAQTRLLERLESVLECLDEAMHHCTD